MNPVTLRAASAWDGAAADPGEVATLQLEWAGDDLRVCVEAPFHDDPRPPGYPGPTPGLWNYEVVELFIADAGANDAVQYLEVELSPHGHHLVLRLEGIRRAVEEGLDLYYTARVDSEARRWTGEAIVPGSWLPPAPHRVNAFAIHGRGDARRYLAWSPLPGPLPDFHQPHRFPRVNLHPATQPWLRDHVP